MALSYEKLFKVLKERNISLTKLEKATKISSATISKLNKNEYVSLQTLEKIAKYLHLPIEALMEFTLENKKSPLLKRLLTEKNQRIKGGIYHETQILFAFNSNHIEGSKLSNEETRYIFETNKLILDKVINIDDVTEMINHFRALDFILDSVFEPLREDYIKALHLILKRNTKAELDETFNIGEYKRLPNVVGGRATVSPEAVEKAMKNLINKYENNKTKTFLDIVDFHYDFECIHPFQDGNGRVGRLIAFKELLRNNLVPFTIDEDLKLFYYRGFKMYKEEKNYLVDTCLRGQDKYKKLLDYYKISY